MGVDYNYNITYYWNCDTNSFHFCWKGLTGFHNTNNVSSGIVDSIIGIAIDIVILYYLYRPHVKVYFGKVTASNTYKDILLSSVVLLV